MFVNNNIDCYSWGIIWQLCCLCLKGFNHRDRHSLVSNGCTVKIQHLMAWCTYTGVYWILNCVTSKSFMCGFFFKQYARKTDKAWMTAGERYTNESQQWAMKSYLSLEQRLRLLIPYSRSCSIAAYKTATGPLSNHCWEPVNRKMTSLITCYWSWLTRMTKPCFSRH